MLRKFVKCYANLASFVSLENLASLASLASLAILARRVTYFSKKGFGKCVDFGESHELLFGQLRKFLASTVKPVLTATSEQWPTVYNGQFEPQFSKIL